MDLGSLSLTATGLITLQTGKGPTKQVPKLQTQCGGGDLGRTTTPLVFILKNVSEKSSRESQMGDFLLHSIIAKASALPERWEMIYATLVWSVG